MYYAGGTSGDPQRRLPSFARSNGHQAVREAMQNHIDRLQSNKTKAAFSQPRMEAASPGSIKRAHTLNAQNPNETFFTPAQERVAGKMERRNSPLGFLGNKAENFLQLKQLGQGLTQSFDPRTREGLVNIASMFAGGPKGDASPMIGKLGMPGQFRDYNMAPVDPLARGIPHETAGQNLRVGQKTGDWGDFGKPEKQVIMDSLVRRAKGVGAYNHMRPNEGLTEINRLEAGLHERQMIRKTQDAVKEYSNRQGFANRNQGGFDAANKRTDTLQGLDRITGGRSIPYVPREAIRTENRQDEDISGPKNLETLMQYLAHYMNRGDDFNIGSQRAAWDQLFGGDFHFGRGFHKFPRKP